MREQIINQQAHTHKQSTNPSTNQTVVDQSKDGHINWQKNKGRGRDKAVLCTYLDTGKLTTENEINSENVYFQQLWNNSLMMMK